jgi:hypothetical protein
MNENEEKKFWDEVIETNNRILDRAKQKSDKIYLHLLNRKQMPIVL